MSTHTHDGATELLRQNVESLAMLRELNSPEKIREIAMESGLRDNILRVQEMLPRAEMPAVPELALNQDPELVGDFILESREHLAAIEAQLLALEQNSQNLEAINAIFRGFHTIKGLAGFLGFAAIQSFAHEVETLLDLARNASVPVNSALIDLILQSADHINQCLRGVETGKQLGVPGPLVTRIKNMTCGVDEAQADLMQLASAVAEPVAAASTTAAAQGDAAPGSRSVRVDTGKLDYLVEMMGELVIAQSLIQHDPDMIATNSPRLMRNLGELTRIATDVQRIAMAMRTIPVGHLFRRMARLVRDLARKTGKQAHLEMSGEETELDRNMVEELADPLMHMIRNAVDHGVEPPEERVALGKDPVARIDLRAYHKGGFINIEIADDGRGLVREKILSKAQQRGLVSGGEYLSDQEVFRLIFEPGLSTAEQVTDVSGRGVGMDVVRKQICKLRGCIDIFSRAGHGTTFIIKLPLTLAIIEGLVVGVGVHRYIVPIFAVREMFRPAPGSVSTLPEGGEMVMVRGSLLPILRLHKRFDVVPRSAEPSEGVLVVVESARENFCVLVDELIGKQEVVIKSLGETFEHATGVAGASILSDGRVRLIIDVEALFASAVRD